MDNDALLEAFIRHLRVERGLSQNTWLSYGYQLKGYLAFLAAHGKGPLSAGRDDILAHLEAKKDAGGRSASLFVAAIAIRQFHRFLHDQGHQQHDPTQGMCLPKFKQRLPEPLSASEMDRLLGSPTGESFRLLRMKAALELIYATGMRVSEMTGLLMGQVRLQDGWVRVLGKGGRERDLPLGPRAKEALQRYLAARKRRFAWVLGHVFLSVRGKPMGRATFWSELRALGRRAGIAKGLFPHRIRHTTGTLMLEGGADLRVIQVLLGHHAITTTARYAQVTGRHLEAACRATHPGFRS